MSELFKNYPRPYITDMELFALIGGSQDRCYSKVKRLLAQGALVHIRKGLYVISSSGLVNPYSLAQFIYGPSYISLESALSFHGLIPEAVRTITSVTPKRANTFQTAFGLFTYDTIPSLNLLTEVTLIAQNEERFYMAKPWKAICDYVFVHKPNDMDIKNLLESLRIEESALPKPSFKEIQLLDEYYHRKRITQFLKEVDYER